MESSIDKKILLVVPQPVVRFGLSQMIGIHSEMTVCAEVGTVEQARQNLAKQDVDLVIVTVEIEGGIGYSFLKELAAHKPKAAPVAYGYFHDAASVTLALRNGARAVISIGDSIEDVLSALIGTTAGKISVTKANAELLGQAMSEPTKSKKQSNQKALSVREQQLYKLLGTSMKQTSIAEKMGLSVGSIDTMTHRIELKIGLKNTLELRQQAAVDLYEAHRLLAPEA
ncbi:MAG: response regulator transcription factor [Verrucomicrobia bacterium]|nr:response regulator transcription factor [Verrucomicrobiota bacterium]